MDSVVDQVLIFDTTLRDGEQSPGISLNAAEKLEIAQQLARVGVDVNEAGFPIASPGDFEAVKDATRPRIHTFISTSDIHILHQLQSTREDVLGQAPAAVPHAREFVQDV